MGFSYQVDYKLSPATRWANHQIDDFTLVIRADNTAKHFFLEEQAFNMAPWVLSEGEGKQRVTNHYDESLREFSLRNGAFTWHKTNYCPSQELTITSADEIYLFNDNAPFGSFYDRGSSLELYYGGDRTKYTHIHGKDTKPELWVRKYLYAHGFRYRLHVKRLPGSPDIVIRRLRTVILVNGCFWHGHTEPPLPSPVEDENGEMHCKYFVMPRTRVDFWTRKIERNKARDLEDRNALKLLGWNVIIIWECQLNQAEIREQTLQSLVRTLSQIELNIAKTKRPAVKKYDFEEEQPYSMVADENDNPSL